MKSRQILPAIGRHNRAKRQPEGPSMSEQDDMVSIKRKKCFPGNGNGIGVGIAIGVAIGAAYGASSGNMGQSVAMGLALGTAFGAAVDFKQRGRSNECDCQE